MLALRLLLVYALAGWAAFVAFRVERLNAAAGNLLPRFVDTLRTNRAEGGSGKWRAHRISPEQWQRWFAHDEAGQTGGRPLTRAERAEMDEEVGRSNAYADLHDFLGRYGWLLQYAVVAVVLRLGVGDAVRARRRPWVAAAFAVPVLAAAAAGVLAVYRGYFTSMVTGI